MNKATFTAALKRAQELQGTYKIEKSRCDALYDELGHEDEQAVLDALKKLGKTDKAISYFNIMAFVEDARPRENTPTSPMLGPPSEEDKKKVKELLDELNEKLKWR